MMLPPILGHMSLAIGTLLGRTCENGSYWWLWCSFRLHTPPSLKTCLVHSRGWRSSA